jgi:hypothetical protein
MLLGIILIVVGLMSYYASNHHMEFEREPLETKPRSIEPTQEMPVSLYPTTEVPVIGTDPLWAATIPESMKITRENPIQP